MKIGCLNAKGYVFDLDGTLIDSIPVWKMVDELYLEQLSLPFTDEIAQKIKAQSFAQTAAFYIAYFNLDKTVEEVQAEWFAMVQHHYANTIPLKAGVRVFLETLKANGLPMAIASSCDPRLIRESLALHGLDSMFDFIITSGELGKSKSQPDIYLYCAKRMGLEPEDIVVFEDLSIAMRSAYRAGFQVVAVKDEDSENDIAHIERFSHHYIEDFTQLLEEGV
ncbi:MAG: HAD family hydrolase [Erysipelotrichaceae bacterium]